MPLFFYHIVKSNKNVICFCVICLHDSNKNVIFVLNLKAH
nr:MAG TPA: hypothetical protein [Caudoviricetes sp.]